MSDLTPEQRDRMLAAKQAEVDRLRAERLSDQSAERAPSETGGDAYRFKNIHTHSPADLCRRSCPAYGDALMTKTAARLNVPQTQNKRGEWVPAIPLPLYVGFRLRKCQCHCGQTFRSGQQYREHYALAHVLGLS